MRHIDNTDFTYLHTASGSTPLSIADAVTRDIGDDGETLKEVIFYLNVYYDRVFTKGEGSGDDGK